MIQQVKLSLITFPFDSFVIRFLHRPSSKMKKYIVVIFLWVDILFFKILDHKECLLFRQYKNIWFCMYIVLLRRNVYIQYFKNYYFEIFLWKLTCIYIFDLFSICHLYDIISSLFNTYINLMTNLWRDNDWVNLIKYYWMQGSRS